jgi:hypothetical protein
MKNSSRSPSEHRKLPQWQQRAIRKLAFTAGGIGIAVMIVGTLVDWWIPTPGRNAFGVVFGLLLLIVVIVRHAYLRGVADAAAHSDRPSE